MNKLILSLIIVFAATEASYAQYYGDVSAGDKIDVLFPSWDFASGAPTDLAGSPVVSCYKDNSPTESTAGITLTAPFDSRTGMNHVRVDTSADGTFYSTGSSFRCVLTAGTVSSLSWVGRPVAQFSIGRAAAALAAINLDQLAKSAVASSFSGSVAANSILGYLSATSATSAYDRTLMSLQASYTNSPTVADIRTEMDSNSTQLQAILADLVVRRGTAQAGAALTITLDSGASATNNIYSGHIVYILSSTGAGQRRQIISYNGTTKVATMDRPWTVNPSSSSVFVILP